MFNFNKVSIAIVLLFLIVFGFSVYQVYAIELITQELDEKAEKLEFLKEEQIDNSAQKRLISEELNEIESDYLDTLEELEEKEKELEEKEKEIEKLNEDLQAKIEAEAKEEALLAQSQSEAKIVQENKDTKDSGLNNDDVENDKSEILSEKSTAKSEQSSSNELETSSSSPETRTLGTFTVTFYAIGDGLTPSTTTANGTEVANTIYSPEGYRIIAVDTSVIPMNSIVRVTLNGESFLAKASDTGSAVNGKKIDLLVNSPSEAIQRGVQNATIELVE